MSENLDDLSRDFYELKYQDFHRLSERVDMIDRNLYKVIELLEKLLDTKIDIEY